MVVSLNEFGDEVKQLNVFGLANIALVGIEMLAQSSEKAGLSISNKRRKKGMK